VLCSSRSVAVALAALLALPHAAAAQASRAEEIARLQAEKAARLRPYEPPAGERILNTVEGVLQGLEPQAFYPWIGSVYPGGSIGLGGGYRYGFGGSASFNALAAWSLRNYKLLQADLRAPAMAAGRLNVGTQFALLDAPRVAFYGIGNQTSRTDRRHYSYEPTRIGLNGSWRLARAVSVGGGIGYLDISAGNPADPTSEALLSVVDPLLGRVDLEYAVGQVFAEVDWRESPGYSRRGGLYRVGVARYTAHHDAPYDFRRTEAEVVQLLPIMRANWVVAVRGLVTTTAVPDGQSIPYFMLPDLGGGSSLRGYPSWRFRDRHRLLLSGEYRWTPGQLLDMALFVDAGKVASTTGDLDLKEMHRNYGIGLRIHGTTFTALRIDVARGREGWVLNLGAGAAF
jgi:hypothetical protein